MLRLAACWLLGLGLGLGSTQQVLAQESTAAITPAAKALHQKYVDLQNALAHNPFGRALTIESSEINNIARGDIYAVVDYSFASVTQGLNHPAHWCDVMLLHLNTKYCHAQIAPQAIQLRIYLGKKTPEPLNSATRLEFRYTVQSAQADYLAIDLNAARGPLGTSDYRITLEAVPLPGNKTFLHLSYAWSSNLSARLAMQLYLNTVASDKVGFTQSTNSRPIGGIRGLVERNTMRYYLAIDSYLASANLPAAKQLDARLQSWFSATERYPLQLHEIERAEYISMKHDEYQRQQSLQ